MFFKQSDDTLITKALNGDQQAWHKLVKRYEALVYSYALRMTSNSSDAMDLMQETFVSVCKNLHQFKGQSAFKTWLMSLAHFRCVDYYRRRKLDLDDEQIVDNLVSIDEGGHPSQHFEKNKTKGELLSYLSQLPFEQKLVVEQKVYQQLTFEQIAEQMGVSTNTVKSKFYSALDKLKRAIESTENAA